MFNGGVKWLYWETFVFSALQMWQETDIPVCWGSSNLESDASLFLSFHQQSYPTTTLVSLIRNRFMRFLLLSQVVFFVCSDGALSPPQEEDFLKHVPGSKSGTQAGRMFT